MFKLVLCGFLCLTGVAAFNHGQDLVDFNNYVDAFNKNLTYATPTDRNNANFYFIYNRNWIDQDNRKRLTYRESINQFTDMRFIHFTALLPLAVHPTVSSGSTPVATAPAVQEFDIITDMGLTIKAEDQGTVCSSSWAYATAKAIEIMQAGQSNPNQLQYTLSAQQLIDCTGLGQGCTTQSPQMAFDYLTKTGNTFLAPIDFYPNRNYSKAQGMCRPFASPPVGSVKLSSYATLPNEQDTTLMRFVSNSIPVVIEYNPKDFGFMHYSSGIYSPPASTAKATNSQFLVVVGYGHDKETNLDYWKCLNSFGETWGENGYIRIKRSFNQPIAKNAIFPNVLA